MLKLTFQCDALVHHSWWFLFLCVTVCIVKEKCVCDYVIKLMYVRKFQIVTVNKYFSKCFIREPVCYAPFLSTVKSTQYCIKDFSFATTEKV